MHRPLKITSPNFLFTADSSREYDCTSSRAATKTTGKRPTNRKRARHSTSQSHPQPFQRCLQQMLSFHATNNFFLSSVRRFPEDAKLLQPRPSPLRPAPCSESLPPATKVSMVVTYGRTRRQMIGTWSSSPRLIEV